MGSLAASHSLKGIQGNFPFDEAVLDGSFYTDFPRKYTNSYY